MLHIERAAQELADPELIWRVRLLSAEWMAREGSIAEALRLQREVNEYATANGPARLLARSHLILASTYRELGDLAASLEHAVKAVELLDVHAPSSVRALYVLRLADSLDECGFLHEARVRYEQAEEFAVRDGNIVRQVSCLNNRAYGEYVAGDVAGAEVTINRLIEVCRRTDTPMLHNTLDTIARIQIAAGRYEEAISTAQEAIEVYWNQDVRAAMSPAESLLTLVLAQRKSGDLDAAQRSLDECRSLGTSRGLASVLARVEEEQAELFAAGGEFEHAFNRLKAFHAAEKALISEKRAAQSNLRQAVLETKEARAEAHRLRGEAQRDPLTGLYNRRFVDEILPGLLAGRAPDEVIAAAMIDLDNFKRVNDMFTHAAGDAVLVEVAQLLTLAARTEKEPSATCFAARLGGEEFLVVLQGLSRAKVAQRLEDLRHAVAHADWGRIVGDLQVTMSAGVSWAGTEDSQYTLLHRADKLLFTAKHAGRDLVCVEDSSSTASSLGDA
jgi:diguanylate cyclase (GGDEF)-like protein